MSWFTVWTQIVSSPRHCSLKVVRVTFTCDSQEEEQQDVTWIQLNAHAHNYVVRKMLRLAKPTYYLDLTPQLLPVTSVCALPSPYPRIALESTRPLSSNANPRRCLPACVIL